MIGKENEIKNIIEIGKNISEATFDGTMSSYFVWFTKRKIFGLFFDRFFVHPQDIRSTFAQLYDDYVGVDGLYDLEKRLRNWNEMGTTLDF